MTLRTQRLRDPVHGLIVFEKQDKLAQLAWKLINTPEFQRLRRIKQLGVSDFVFPGAVHTRFAHSIGVFHTARELVRIVERESVDARPFDRDRANVAIVAALLHDLGHGPFSHAFEGMQMSRGVGKRRDKWTAEIIRNADGAIHPLLEAHGAGMTEEVAELLAAEDPTDVYHAVVSSSFDADRLDYLRRDRLMTGTDAGAIDHALLRFFAPSGETIDNYLALDDLAIAGSLERMQQGGDPEIAMLAARLRERRLYKTLDIGRFGSDLGRQRQAARRIDHEFGEKLGNGEAIKDESASVGIYTPIGGDEEKMHNKLHILDAGGPREITEMSRMIEALASKRQFTRYYFADAAERGFAIEKGKGR